MDTLSRIQTKLKALKTVGIDLCVIVNPNDTFLLRNNGMMRGVTYDSTEKVIRNLDNRLMTERNKYEALEEALRA